MVFDNFQSNQALFDLQRKVDLLSDKLDHMIELGITNEENISDIQNTLRDHSGTLHQLAYSFKQRIRKLNKFLALTSCLAVLFLFWIVLKILALHPWARRIVFDLICFDPTTNIFGLT